MCYELGSETTLGVEILDKFKIFTEELFLLDLHDTD